MRFLLINPPVRTWAKPNMVPLGLASLATSLIHAGHDVDVWDANVESRDCLTSGAIAQELQRRWSQSPWDAMGVGGIVTVFKWAEALLACNEGSPWRDKPCFVGGPMAQTAGDVLQGRCCIVHGEGETAIHQIEQTAKGGAYPKEFASQRPALDLALLDFPARHLFDMETYLSAPIGYTNINKWVHGMPAFGANVRNTNLQGTRGCPYNCHYCRHDFMGMKWRCRPAWHVVAEMLDLEMRYDCSYLHFVDDEFCANPRWVGDVCDYITAWGMAAEWGCTGRVNLITRSLLKTMDDSGCRHMGLGIESGSQTILNNMNKGVTVQCAAEALAIATDCLEDVNTSYMIGYPGETEQTLEETAEFIRMVKVKPSVVFFATPYPGTKLYDMAVEQGKIPSKRDYCLRLDEQGRQIVCNMSDLSDARLLEWQKILSAL